MVRETGKTNTEHFETLRVSRRFNSQLEIKFNYDTQMVYIERISVTEAKKSRSSAYRTVVTSGLAGRELVV